MPPTNLQIHQISKSAIKAIPQSKRREVQQHAGYTKLANPQLKQIRKSTKLANPHPPANPQIRQISNSTKSAIPPNQQFLQISNSSKSAIPPNQQIGN